MTADPLLLRDQPMQPSCKNIATEAGRSIITGMDIQARGQLTEGVEMALCGLFAIAPLVRCHKHNESLPCSDACRMTCNNLISRIQSRAA